MMATYSCKVRNGFVQSGPLPKDEDLRETVRTFSNFIESLAPSATSVFFCAECNSSIRHLGIYHVLFNSNGNYALVCTQKCLNSKLADVDEN